MRDRYTHGHHDSVLRAYRARTAANSAQYLVPHLNRGDRLLDVGCGPGTISADLAELVAPGEVVAIDRAPEVLDEARGVAAGRGLTNIAFEMGDVYSLDHPSGSFDVVHAHQVLQHLSDPVSGLREMRRLARDGGLVAVRDADYAAMTWYPADASLDKWREIYSAVARSNNSEPDAGRRVLAWAHEAGFSEVVPSASAWCFADEETRTWWSQLWVGRMTESSIADQAVSKGIATTEELAEVAEGFEAWGAHADAWFTVTHGEILARP